jgi:CHASE2 domain-containing sensor protein
MMNREQFRQLQQTFAVWKVGVVPGAMVIGLVVFLRALGLLQPLEWWALDCFLRLRPAERTDEQILIVGIDEKDIQSIGSYPIPDANLATLIEKLQTYQPRAIGLDIVRDLPVEPGHKQFTQVLQKFDNIIGIEKALPDAEGRTVNPPSALPSEQVGFADLIYDTDGALRRALIGTPTEAGYKFSLPLLLVEKHLYRNKPSLVMENGIRDFEAIRFGTVEFTRFRTHSGGYVNADARGNQFLINYRRSEKPFHIVTLTDIMQGKVSADWIRDRLILIGITATSVGDLKQTNAVSNSGLIYGVEAHAHIASQMINSALYDRPWLNTWEDFWEYTWIILWGIIGISLGRFLLAPLRVILGAGLAGLTLIGVSFTALTIGWWLAVIPAFLALVFNSLLTSLFYRHQQELRERLRERQLVIDQIYTAIHNVPVQTLAGILRAVRSGGSPQHLIADLEQLEQELRAIEESVRQSVTQTDDVYLCGDTKLNLQHPLHQLLYEVYRVTLMRSHVFPIFATVVKLPQFEDIENRRLSNQQKQGLCRFLEEAICNAGKYAEGMTRLEVSCKTVDGWNIVRIVDNGIGLKEVSTPKGGYGTKQANTLAHQLGGKFRRVANSPQGTICELAYPVQPWLSLFWSKTS